MNEPQHVFTHLCGFFFFIILAETPACPEEKRTIQIIYQTAASCSYKMVMVLCVPAYLLQVLDISCYCSPLLETFELRWKNAQALTHILLHHFVTNSTSSDVDSGSHSYYQL